MASYRSARSAEGKFVQLANSAGQDPRLSLEARGIIYFVLSLPPDKHFTAQWLETQVPNGRESIRKALREMEGCGYLTRTKKPGEGGRWQWDQVISDAPSAGKPPDGNPSNGATCDDTEFAQVAPSDGNPSNGKPSNKELTRDTRNTETPAARRAGRGNSEVLANSPLRNARGGAA